MEESRRNEIDWIRNICILMLFLYHTFEIYRYGSQWYIISEEKSIVATIFISLVFSWYMPLLFFLAGASTYFALKRRNKKEYIRERVKRLLIPFIFGLVIIVPPQTWLAVLSKGNRNVSYIQQMKFFFTNISDFTGVDGMFTPAHLWFILFLFIISVIGIFIIDWLKKERGKVLLRKLKNIFLSKRSLMFIIIFIFIGEIFPELGGKSIAISLELFLLGYIVYSDEEYLIKIDKEKKSALLISIILSIGILPVFLNYNFINITLIQEIVIAVLRNSIMITSIISIIGYGRKYLNRSNKVLIYLNKSSFPIYMLHQTVIIMIAYKLVPVLPVYSGIVTIIIMSIVITFTLYEISNKVSFFRVMLGIKE